MKFKLIYLTAVYVTTAGCSGSPEITSEVSQERYQYVKNLDISLPSNINILIGLLNDHSKLVRLGVVERFFEIDDDRYYSHLIPALDDPSWEVRREVSKLYCSKLYKPSLDKLIEMARKDDSDFVRAVIIRNISSFEDPRIPLLLKELASDSSQVVRYYAKRQLETKSDQ